VFTPLAVARAAQDRNRMAIRNVIRSSARLRSATIAIKGAVQTFPPAYRAPSRRDLDASQALKK